MKRSPGLVALSDNQVLRFISEFWKMLSVADGEMAYDSISHSVIIDKDGFRPRSECNGVLHPKKKEQCFNSTTPPLPHPSRVLHSNKQGVDYTVARLCWELNGPINRE